MKKTILGLKTLMVLTLLLTACAPAATPEPTIDANQLYTQAAQTVIAQLTKNAPPATQTPAVTKAPTATNTLQGGLLPTLPPLSTLPSLSTPTRSALNIADKAQYITQSPGDGTNVTAGKVFNITWHLKNTGTTTWNTNYVYRFYAAVNKIGTAANGYNLTKSVPPNGEIDLTVVATAPGNPGTYDTKWVLTNAEGSNFSSFDLSINVVAGPTGGGGSEATAVIPGVICELIVQDGNTKPISAAYTWEVSGSQVVIYFASQVTPGTDFTVEIDSTPPDQGGTYNTFSSASPIKVSLGTNKGGHKVKVTPAAAMQVTTVSSYSANSNCF